MDSAARLFKILGMPATNAAFVGTVPENYERYLVPMLFEQYANELVKRVPPRAGSTVLETACGTGVVTAKLRAHLPADARLCATDLNEGMLNFARAKRGAAGIEWLTADMTALPFPDAAFDVVLCQFGMMFVPDKTLAAREARRVLKDGGRFVFSVWDSLAANGISRVGHETIVAMTEPEPVRFFETPFGFSDADQMRAWVEEAGFREVKETPVEVECISATAYDAAAGLVQGTPVVVALKERDPALIPKLTDAVAQAIAREFGDKPARGKMRALVWEATR